MSVLCVGIDPGKGGGIATIHPYDGAVVALPMEYDDGLLLEMLRGIDEEARLGNLWIDCAIELPPRYTGRNIPGSTIAPLFQNYGMCVGIAMALRWTVDTVRPQKWQTALSLGNSKQHPPGQWKKYLKSAAIKAFPYVKVTLKNADALLIADYCRRNA